MQRRPIIYFSGIDREAHLKLLAQEQAAGMVTAAHAMRPGLLNALAKYPSVPLVLDSGFAQKPSFEDYAALLDLLDRQYHERFRWFASFDAPGDQERSDAGYDRLLARLPHLRQRILWIFQPTWRRCCYRRLELACEEHATLAIGGLVPLVRRSLRDALKLLQEIGEVLNAYYPTEAHVLGVTSPDLLAWLCTQPWVASLDSSRWIRAARAREVLLLSGEQRKAATLQLPLTQDECAALNIRAVQTWVKGPSGQLQWKWGSLDKEGKGNGLMSPRNRGSAHSMLLRHRGKRVLCVPLDLASPSFDWYIPLFTVSGREHGLLAFEHAELFPQEADWSVVWDVDTRDDPVLPRSRLFLLDGRLKTGIFSHDDAFFPCLCHYPLATALQVAKSLAPFSSSRNEDAPA